MHSIFFHLSPSTRYSEDQNAMAGSISVAQLQRLMDEDKALRILLGTGRAKDVIKKFAYQPDDADRAQYVASMQQGLNRAENASEHGTERSGTAATEVGATENINQLQEIVFSRLDKLEKDSLDVDVMEIPQIRFLSNTLSDLFGEVQNNWREGVTQVLEAATMISGGLLAFTKSVEDVSANHNIIMEALCMDDDSSDEEDEGSDDN